MTSTKHTHISFHMNTV